MVGDVENKQNFIYTGKVSKKKAVAALVVIIVSIVGCISFSWLVASDSKNDDGFVSGEFGELVASFTLYRDQIYTYGVYEFKVTAVVFKDKHIRLEIWKDAGFYDEKRLYLTADRYYYEFDEYVLSLVAVDKVDADFKLYKVVV